MLASKSSSTISKHNVSISSSPQLSKEHKPMDFYTEPDMQSWNPMRSLGSFLLQRKGIDGYRPNLNQSSEGIDATSTINRTTVNVGRVEIIDETRPKNNNPSIISTMPYIPDIIFNATSILSEISFKSIGDIDKEQAKELDESISMLSNSRDVLMRDIKILNSTSPPPSPLIPNKLQSYAEDDSFEIYSTKSNNSNVRSKKRKWWAFFFRRVKAKSDESSRVADFTPKPSGLPLISEPQHIERIEMDMRHLAVTIGSSIDTTAQWKLFCENGGSILPILQCIMDGASAVVQGVTEDSGNEPATSLSYEKHYAVLAAASSACKVLRDLCTISKALSVMLTDEILRYDAAWSKTVWLHRKRDEACRTGGIISAMLTLLHHSFEVEVRTDPLNLPTNARSFGSRRKRKEARRKCGLYVLQLLYSMAFASDDAINTFRAHIGFVDSVRACSSLDQKEQLRRRWIRYPLEVLKRKLFPQNSESFDTRNTRNAFLAAASITGGLTGQIQAVANQILAAIGYNVWVPKIPGQKGIRILSLDGGGTRGITAISTLKAIVGAMGGIEVCDSFDMIVGTSTGAIIAFLVGLRRESSQMAKRRYDRLIRRIFVKSALSTPMLFFTTATYDESPFNAIMQEILQDNSMLASRADPRVPYVFAVSSKMGSTPTQLCLFRNYNYSGGEKRDPFVMSSEEARSELGLAALSEISILQNQSLYEPRPNVCITRNIEASRHTGSFRVLQRVALRATTAAPTVFKPVKLGGDLYCDGGIGASNPTAVAIHEARILFPNIPIEMVVSCGTGAFVEENSAPRIGWDGIISQIIMSATDCEQTHHILEDILGQGGTVKGRSSISQTKYFRFNPVVGAADTFPIDNTDPVKLEELNEITTRYMKEPTQARKLREISAILGGQPWWKKLLKR